MSAELCAQYSLVPKDAVSGCQGHFTLERGVALLPADDGRVPAGFLPPDSAKPLRTTRVNHFRILEDEGGMFELSDDMATRINVLFYSDTPDALFKALLE